MAEQERQQASSLDKGHGRIERRHILTTTALKGYSDWPGLEQVFRLERQRILQGKSSTEVAYGITSLPRQRADASMLLRLSRQHWGIENSLFGVRDVTLGEDHCRVRSGAAPLILSSVRNLAIHLLRTSGATNLAAALRRHAAQPHLALALIHDTS